MRTFAIMLTIGVAVAMIAVLVAHRSPTIEAAASSKFFYITALVTSPETGFSEFQCWQLSTPAGSIGGIVDTYSFVAANTTTYNVYPPRLQSGLHPAPTAQYVGHLTGHCPSIIRIKYVNGQG
jgi:hypothetical protein